VSEREKIAAKEAKQALKDKKQAEKEQKKLEKSKVRDRCKRDEPWRGQM
jgi:hypothetical protein